MTSSADSIVTDESSTSNLTRDQMKNYVKDNVNELNDEQKKIVLIILKGNIEDKGKVRKIGKNNTAVDFSAIPNDLLTNIYNYIKSVITRGANSITFEDI
jgi:hypothetical protein